MSRLTCLLSEPLSNGSIEKVTRIAREDGPISVTHSLTCRQRKLKCDEQKPACGPCLKANRECRASEAVVFRHQQNPSMNAAGSGNEGNLPSFYGYRSTFDTNHTWVKIPEQVTFVHTSNPYADDPDVDPALEQEPQSSLDGPLADWGADAAYRSSTTEFAAHSLEHLAAAASDQYPYNAQISGAGQGMMSTAPPYAPYHSQEMSHPPDSSVRGMLSSSPSTASYSTSNKNLNSILNHSTTLSPVIDPSLQRAVQRRSAASSPPITGKKSRPNEKRKGKAQDDHEMAALLRGIAEDHPTQRQEGSLVPNG